MTDFASHLTRIAGLAGEFKLANLLSQIAACERLMQANHGIDVAVFGRFKAGKSSFLNHLAGRDVLPIGVVPLTAVITRLRYGPVDKAVVRFLDGLTRTIPVSDIMLFVSEHENPENRKQVVSVDVELPALQAFAPLQFVDTPGLGSAFAHNSEVAMEWLPNVGAALVAVSSDAPLSERDIVLLEELRHHTPKIVLLLTKADLLTEAQRSEVMEFVQEQIHRKWNWELPVFFYSVQPALAVLKTELQKRLLDPLLHDRANATGQILRYKLASLVSQTLDYLNIALASATQADSSRQALRERLDKERQQFDLLREELQLMAREWSAKALNQSLERLKPIQRTLQGKVTRELKAQFPQWRLRLPLCLKAWREWLQSFLARELSEVSHTQQTMFCEPVQIVSAHLARTVRAFQDRLAGHIQAAFGVTIAPCEFAPNVQNLSAPPVDVNYAFDAAFSTLGHILPMALFRRPVERVLLRKARYEVEKNLSRLAAGWSDRVSVAISALTQQAEQHARNELTTLEQMLSQTKSDEPRLREVIANLEADDALLWEANLPSAQESHTLAGTQP